MGERTTERRLRDLETVSSHLIERVLDLETAVYDDSGDDLVEVPADPAELSELAGDGGDDA